MTPTADWPLDKLTRYLQEMGGRLSTIERKSLRMEYRYGAACQAIYERLKGEWRGWAKENNIPLEPFRRRRLLYERAGSLKALDQYKGKMEAYYDLGIMPRPDKPDTGQSTRPDNLIKSKAPTPATKRKAIVNQISHTDALTFLADLPSDTVHLTVTSPPYDNMRDYGGHDFDWREVAKELWRVTTDGGIVCWQYQDQIRNGSESCESARQKVFFSDLGFRVHQTLTILTQSFRPLAGRYYRWSSQVFVFAKGKPRTINLLRDRPNITAGTKLTSLSHRDPKGNVRVLKPQEIAESGIRGDVWTYRVGGRPKDSYLASHPAVMREELARDLILSYSAPGDLILDPCCGTGTTLKLALINGRKYLGCDPWDVAYEIATRRLKEASDTGHRPNVVRLTPATA